MRAALLTTCALALVACGWGTSAPEREQKLVSETLLELDLREPLSERPAPLLQARRPSQVEALLRLRKLGKDPLARGLFVRVGSFGGSFADVDDWAQAFESFRRAHKPVHCHFDELDNSGYALASHCDRLSMTPSGLLNLVGLALQAVHGRALLELVGLRAELFQVGKYKGAAEPFTRDAMSNEQAESLEILLTDLDRAFREHLLRRTKRGASELQQLLDGGPYIAERAHKAGLVDALAYDDEAREKAKRTAGARVVNRPFEPKADPGLSLSELARALLGPREREYEGQPHLAVAYLTGDIRDGEASGVDGAASEPFIKALRRWGDRADVRAVLLRIESPGGSALASDRMWHAVARVAKRKPVVVSLGDMAASGGYYVASAGGVIVAAPGSVVGSIGVVGGKVVLESLAERAGVHVTALSRSQRSTWLSPFQGFSAEERGAIEQLLQSTYRRFLDRVARGRKRNVAALLPAAEGRVMGGERARTLGLVDEVGGLARALTLALERGKLSDDTPLETWPDDSDPLAALSSLMAARSAQGSWAGQLEASLPAELLSGGSLVRELLRSPRQALAALPFALQLR